MVFFQQRLKCDFARFSARKIDTVPFLQKTTSFSRSKLSCFVIECGIQLYSWNTELAGVSFLLKTCSFSSAHFRAGLDFAEFNWFLGVGLQHERSNAFDKACERSTVYLSQVFVRGGPKTKHIGAIFSDCKLPLARKTRYIGRHHKVSYSNAFFKFFLRLLHTQGEVCGFSVDLFVQQMSSIYVKGLASFF